MRDISPESPEARRKRLASATRAFRHDLGRGCQPRSRAWEVVKRVAIGVYADGFIHAGNLAYLALLALFPFFIVAAAVAHLFGQTRRRMRRGQRPAPDDAARRRRRCCASRSTTCSTARSGTLLWLGALVGLWTTGSFIETIRDILRRAYGVTFSPPFWEYRLGSVGIIIVAVVLVMLAFSVSILLSGVQQFLVERLPGAGDLIGLLTLLRAAPGPGPVRLALPALLRR